MANPIGIVHEQQLRAFIDELWQRFPRDGDGNLIRRQDGRLDLTPIEDYLNGKGGLNRTKIACVLRFSDRTILNHHAGCRSLLTEFEAALGINNEPVPPRQNSVAAQKEIDVLREQLEHTRSRLLLASRELKVEQQKSNRLEKRLEQFEAIQQYQVATGRNLPAAYPREEQHD